MVGITLAISLSQFPSKSTICMSQFGAGMHVSWPSNYYQGFWQLDSKSQSQSEELRCGCQSNDVMITAIKNRSVFLRNKGIHRRNSPHWHHLEPSWCSLNVENFCFFWILSFRFYFYFRIRLWPFPHVSFCMNTTLPSIHQSDNSLKRAIKMKIAHAQF